MQRLIWAFLLNFCQTKDEIVAFKITEEIITK